MQKSPMPFIGPSHMWPEIHFPEQPPAALDPRFKIKGWVLGLIVLSLMIACGIMAPIQAPIHKKPVQIPKEDVELQQRCLAIPMVQPSEPKPPANAAYVARLRKYNQTGHPLIHPMPTTSWDRGDREHHHQASED